MLLKLECTCSSASVGLGWGLRVSFFFFSKLLDDIDAAGSLLSIARTEADW